MALIGLRYVGDGAYRPSLPARDMDAAEMAAVATAQKRSVEELAAEATACGLYQVITDEPEAPAAAEPETVEQLAHRSRKELDEIAAALGIDPTMAPNKTSLAELIVAAREAAAAEPPTPAKGEE